MSETVQLISRASMAAPAIIAIARCRSFTRKFFPFFLLLLLGFTNELVNFILDSDSGNIKNINSNVYIILEFLTILWLFYRWDESRANNSAGYLAVATTAVIIWLVENLWFNRVIVISEVTRIFNSFVICLLAVNHINRLLIHERESVLRNPAFIICCAFVLYFAYKILVEVFYMHVDGYFNITWRTEEDKKNSPIRNLARNIYSIHDYVNTLFNLILATAVICLPKKHTFFSRP